MSLTVSVLDSIVFWTDIADTDGPSGAAAVEQALAEANGLDGLEFTATLGEPDIGSIGGEFISAPQVIIPIEDAPAGDAGELVLDIEEFQELFDLMEVSAVAEVADYEVPIDYITGEVHVRWDKVAADDDTEEDGSLVADGTDADDGGSEDSGVTVEEQSVSPGDSSEREPATGDD